MYAFSDDLASRQITIPGAETGDTEFFHQVGTIFSSDDNLPPGLVATLSTIAIMVAASAPSSFSALRPHAPPPPRYSIRRGLSIWRITFGGQPAEILHERGMSYVAWLLLNPPAHPIHAIDLLSKTAEFYRQQLGLPSLVDLSTGKTAIVQSHSRLQERSLALDDAETMRALLRQERQLEAILDSEDASEPEKNEALRELESIAEFRKQRSLSCTDSAQRAVRTVRMAIHRLHQRLSAALDSKGDPHPVLRPFAHHLEQHLIRASASRTASTNGCFTYAPPPGVFWQVAEKPEPRL